MNIILVTLFFVFGGTYQNTVRIETKLSTGWYYIIDEDKGIKRQLNKTEDYYFLEPNPIVTAKNIKKIEFDLDNEGKDYLVVQFDAPGTKAWSRATAKSIGRRLGFIFNDKLLEVPMVNSEITGGISAIWNGSKSELEIIKKAIEKARNG